MKKMIKLLLVFGISVNLIACSKAEYVYTDNGVKVQDYGTSLNHPSSAFANSSYEICYDGIVYVMFSSGNSAWGSVKFDQDSKVVKCKNLPQSPSKN